MMGLTAKQRGLYDFIAAYIGQRGFAPTFAEMAEGIGLSAKTKGEVHRLIVALEDRGVIRRLPHKSRAIELVPQGDAIELRPEVRDAAVRYASQHGIKLSTVYSEAIAAYVVGDKAA